ALVARYRVVAIVTGRRSEEIAPMLDAPGVRLLGVYGLEDGDHDRVSAALLERVRSAAAVVPVAWVEDKGVAVAVHYRAAPDHIAARDALTANLAPLADAEDMELVQGKMVLELMPPDRPRKGGAVLRLADELALLGVLFAGDDVADLEAFEAASRLASQGALAIRVAVRGPETPAALLEEADVIVDGPSGLVDLLRALA
ncbi:MAG TPA: trehalose-phosphatase, partial [Actinomycetota bacterium]|nr:trehalose-phosphatase [Actinomycetota bacterium]